MTDEHTMKKAGEIGIQTPALLSAALQGTRHQPGSPEFEQAIADFQASLDQLRSINNEAVAWGIAYWSMKMVDQLCAQLNYNAEEVIQHFALTYLSTANPGGGPLHDE